MTDDLDDLAVAVGVMDPPQTLMPSAPEWVAGVALTVLAGVVVISGSSVWDMLT